MKKLIIGLAVVLSLIITVVLVAPGFIDWNGYRDQIARQLSAMTGREVAIEGAIDFGLLPTPTLSARDIRIGPPMAASYVPEITVGALDVRAALLPLLSGRLEADRMILIDPVIVVERPAEGRPAGQGDEGGVRPRDIRLDRVAIENGTVVWRDGASGDEERIDHVFAQFSAESLSGPFQLSGSLSVRGRRLAVDLTAGRISSAGAMPVSATLGVDGASSELRFRGLLATAPFRLQGDVRAEGGSLDEVLGRLWPDLETPPAAEQPFEIAAALLATRESAELNGLTMTLGDTRATGAVSVALGDARRIDVALSANRWDLDTLVTDGDGPFAWPDGGAILPTDWAATADVTVDALTWRGGLIRNARLEGVLSDGVLALNTLSADLPGNAATSIVGTVRNEDGAPYVDLSGSIEASDLRRLLDWAGYPLDAVPRDRLRRVTGTARLTGTPRQFSLTGVEIGVDGSAVTGGLAYVDQGRPGFGLRLAVDRVNLDAYWPGGAIEPLEDLWRPLVDLAGRVDANVDATIGAATVAGMALGGVRLDGTLSGGALTLRRMGIDDIAGAKVGITGTVAELAPLSGMDLDVDVAADDFGRLATALGIKLPVPADRLGALAATGRVQGGAERVALRLSGEAAGGTVDLGGTVDDVQADPVYDLAVRVGHPRAATAAALLWPDYAPRAELGGLDLYAKVSGPAERLAFNDLQGQLGPVSLAGTATVDRTGDRPAVELNLRSSAIPLDDFVPAGRRGRSVIDLSALRGVDGTLALTAAGMTVGGITLDDPALRAGLKAGTLSLEALSAGLFGGKLGLAGQVVAEDVPEVTLSVDLVGAALAPALQALGAAGGISGTVDFGADLSTVGNTPEALVRALSGNGLIAVRDGVVDGFDLAAASRRLGTLSEPLQFLDLVDGALSEGQTPFATLNATFEIDGGMARTDDLRMVTVAGVGNGKGTADLARRQIDLVTDYTFYEHPKAPPLGVVLDGLLHDPQRRLQTQALQAYIAQRAAEELARRFSAPPDPAAPPAPAEGGGTDAAPEAPPAGG